MRPSKAITWVDVYDRRERWTTEDGDFFHVVSCFSSHGSDDSRKCDERLSVTSKMTLWWLIDTFPSLLSQDYLYSDAKSSSSLSSASDKPTKPIAIVLHGLESTSSALLPRSMAKAFAQRGLDVAALNFRGCCGGEDNLKPYSYHLGFTDDIKFAIKKLHAENPGRHIYLSGFSLGANVILKALGELGEEAISLHVKGAAVSNVPFDANLSSGKLDSGFNRAVYVSNFLTTLKTKAKRKWDMDPESDMYDIQRVLSCSKIGDFDDEVIAKLHGFEGKEDYYKKSDSKQYLPFIRVPTLVINAIDDPFINDLGLPKQEDIGPDVPVRLVCHEHGGHCGFITGKEGPREEDRWLPTELARFFDHLENPYGRKGEPSRRGIEGGAAGQESGSSSSLPPALA